MIPSSQIKYAKQYSTLLYRANHEVQLRRVAKYILQSYQTSERSSVIDRCLDWRQFNLGKVGRAFSGASWRSTLARKTLKP